ncbi:unnamed protein product [Lactuca virosa]|uniref:Uncharacterized protein n=1 Tax=Lactuca virosa TaxID=75947 RepID=A0AAU9NHB4_9ASTR|nr:unnamed protein product [Lactuca virosa]
MPRGNLMKHFETDFQRSDINQIIPSGSRLAVCKGEGQPSQSKLYHVLTLLPKSRRIALASKWDQALTHTKKARLLCKLGGILD